MEQAKSMKKKTFLWLGVFFGVLFWSGIEPKDRLTWFLEAGPTIIGLIVMGITRKSFPLTPLLSFWILLHCIVLMVGGKYTYAEVPLFDWISETFGWERNNYDKVGHLMPKLSNRLGLLGLQRLLRIDRVVGGNHDRRSCR
jgi:putative membrane protein